MIIYKITNKINGKIYIGQTVMPLKRRWSQHKCAKRRSPLYSSMQSHGVDNFQIEEICKATTLEELSLLEIKYINEFNCMYPNGYNLSTGGHSSNGTTPWNKGLTGLKPPKSAFKKGLIPWNKYTPMAEETKLKLSIVKRGKRASPETEFKPGKPSAFKGRKHTPESLALVSKNGNRKEIQCIETGEIFNSMKEASEKTGIAKSHLWRLCYNSKKDIKRGLSFKFI